MGQSANVMTSSSPSAQTFCDRLATHDDRIALVDPDGGRVTYGELDARATALAGTLGDIPRLVFLEASNSVASIVAYLACLKGRHPVLLTASDDPAAADLCDRYGPNVVYSGDGDGFDWRHDRALNLHPDLAVLLSTSGSTGSPKLVKLSRRSIDANAQAIAEYLVLGPGERAMTSLKFHYSYGMSVINSHLASGGTLVLSELSVSDPEFWEHFRAQGATSFAGVPHTFEILRQTDELTRVPTLQFITQAGGRLAPQLVRHYARLGAAHDWELVVMYGQTEAGPRMAYLPADQAEAHPDCIGIAIPGGRLDLLDDAGRIIDAPETPGQLVFSGPNIMMGYATTAHDLASDETPARLLTGDIACRTADGLFRIVGRTSRFVKPFGLRVNLDDLEARLQSRLPGARIAGTDDRIVIGALETQRSAAATAATALADACRLPRSLFSVAAMGAIPRLPTGKVDYRGILAAADASRAMPVAPVARGLRAIFTVRFVRQYVRTIGEILGLRQGEWHGVAHIYQTLLAKPAVLPSDSFRGLSGDSLSYVQVTIALQQYLGRLPRNWAELSVRDLELEALNDRDRAL